MDSQKKTGMKIKEGCGCGEEIAEILLSLLFLGIGAVVLSVFGIDTDAEWLDGELMMLIGIFAIAIPVAIIFAVVHIVRKRKKNNIKRIEIHSKNEPEKNEENQENQQNQEENSDNEEKKGQDNV
jgi:NADH:ubiquinone oxidoreductase subunit K